MKDKLLVVVKGGMVQAIHSDINMEVIVCDHDNIEQGDEEPVFEDGTTVDAFIENSRFGLW